MQVIAIVVLFAQHWHPLQVWLSISFAGVVSAPPLVGFWLWARPRFDRKGLPRRSLVLLGLLLAYIPIEILFYDSLLHVGSLENLRYIGTHWPMLGFLRQLDKPTLALLAAWAYWQGPTMGPKSQLVFHSILYLCLLSALSPLADRSVKLAINTIFGVGDN